MPDCGVAEKSDEGVAYLSRRDNDRSRKLGQDRMSRRRASEIFYKTETRRHQSQLREEVDKFHGN